MCLDRIDRVKPRATGMGYKVFRVRNDGPLVLAGEFSEGERRTGKWLKSDDFIPSDICVRANDYVPGFHIFKSLKAAQKWGIGFWDTRNSGHLVYHRVIRCVKYRKARVQGITIMRTLDDYKEYRAKTIVANEIYILPGEGPKK